MAAIAATLDSLPAFVKQYYNSKFGFHKIRVPERFQSYFLLYSAINLTEEHHPSQDLVHLSHHLA